MGTVTREQIGALATELVDYITGEPDRAETAMSNGHFTDKGKRKSNLVAEVTGKIEALIGVAPPVEPHKDFPKK